MLSSLLPRSISTVCHPRACPPSDERRYSSGAKTSRVGVIVAGIQEFLFEYVMDSRYVRAGMTTDPILAR